MHGLLCYIIRLFPLWAISPQFLFKFSVPPDYMVIINPRWVCEYPGMNDTGRKSISDVSQMKFIVGNRGKIICVICLKNQFLGIHDRGKKCAKSFQNTLAINKQCCRWSVCRFCSYHTCYQSHSWKRWLRDVSAVQNEDLEVHWYNIYF